MNLAEYPPSTWVDDDGSNTVGTLVSAGRMNPMELALQDASLRTRQVDVIQVTNADVAGGKNITLDGELPANVLRVLLLGQTDPAENGIYDYAQFGNPSLTRATDGTLDKFAEGQLVWVRGGYTYDNSLWVCTGNAPLTFSMIGQRGRFHRVGAAGEPAFSNNWSNFDANRPIGFYRIDGVCRFEGLMKLGTLAAAAFTLPEGFRPVVPGLNFPVTANSAYGNCAIAAGGVVMLNAGSNAWVDLSVVSFRCQ